MERLTDLRFVIGLFFSILAMMLLAAAFFVNAATTYGQSLNLYSGLAMGGFGVLMLVSAVRSENI